MNRKMRAAERSCATSPQIPQRCKAGNYLNKQTTRKSNWRLFRDCRCSVFRAVVQNKGLDHSSEDTAGDHHIPVFGINKTVLNEPNWTLLAQKGGRDKMFPQSPHLSVQLFTAAHCPTWQLLISVTFYEIHSSSIIRTFYLHKFKFTHSATKERE